MRSIKCTFAVCIIFAALFLAGCASVGSGDKKPEAPPPETDGAAVEGEETPSFAVIPNPYQAGDIPSGVKRDFGKAKTLMAAKKWNEAQAVLEKVVENHPKLSGPFVNLGIIHQQRKEFDYAEKAFKYAVELNPLNFDGYTALGLLYREQGRFKEAESVYLSALERWPHHLASTTNIGILYDLYMGRLEEALQYYELSQNISGGEDKQLRGWIADLKRRMANQ